MNDSDRRPIVKSPAALLKEGLLTDFLAYAKQSGKFAGLQEVVLGVSELCDPDLAQPYVQAVARERVDTQRLAPGYLEFP
jgi:hypothetical protein